MTTVDGFGTEAHNVIGVQKQSANKHELLWSAIFLICDLTKHGNDLM